MTCASSGHITKPKQSIFAPFDIYENNRVRQELSLRIKLALQQEDLLDNSLTSTLVQTIGEGFQLEIKRGEQLILN